MEVHVATIEDFNAEARRFARALRRASDVATIVTLSGELGAGKTTFTQALAKEFGIEDTVTSPTFVIEKIYNLVSDKQSFPLQAFTRLVHIDAYRLKGAHDLKVLGWKELVAEPNNLIILEWPEHVAGAVPQDAIQITLKESREGRTIFYGEK